MSTIPQSQLIDVNPSVLPAGGSAIDLTGLFLTTNARVPIGTVLPFASQAAVATYFGAASQEAGAATVYFAGPDISTKKPGTMLFTQYNTAAVSAFVRGGNISNLPLATLQSYNATLSVTIDGTLKSATINLSAATSFSNAAEIIGSALGIDGVADGVVTGSIGGTFGTCTTTGTTLTLGSVTTGSLWPGDTVTATDGTNTLNTTIVSQLTGTPGGSASATFQLAAAATPGNLTSSTVTAVSTVLNVTGVTSGKVSVADAITSISITGAPYVASLGTGTGGTGTYNLSGAQQRVASETVDAFKPGVIYDPTAGAFQINSGTTGPTSTITYGSGALATDLLLTQVNGAVLSQGAAIAVPATFMNAVVFQTTNWATFTYLFDPDGGSGFTNKLAFAAWTNGQNNRYAHVSWDTNTAPTLANPATTSYGYALTQAAYSGTILDWEPSDLNHAAFSCGWAASLDFTAQNGRMSLAYRTQTGLAAAVTDGVTSVNLGGNPQSTSDRGNGYNFYGTYGSGNTNSTYMQRGFCSGPYLWADSYVNQIQFSNSLQVALNSYLTAVGSTPFNQAGYTAVENSLSAAIAAAGNFGTWVPGVTLSASQIAGITAAAGAAAAQTLQNRGWYLQITPASPTVRAARGPLAITLWYTDGQSIGSISLNSVLVQ